MDSRTDQIMRQSHMLACLKMASCHIQNLQEEMKLYRETVGSKQIVFDSSSISSHINSLCAEHTQKLEKAKALQVMDSNINNETKGNEECQKNQKQSPSPKENQQKESLQKKKPKLLKRQLV